MGDGTRLCPLAARPAGSAAHIPGQAVTGADALGSSCIPPAQLEPRRGDRRDRQPLVLGPGKTADTDGADAAAVGERATPPWKNENCGSKLASSVGASATFSARERVDVASLRAAVYALRRAFSSVSRGALSIARQATKARHGHRRLQPTPAGAQPRAPRGSLRVPARASPRRLYHCGPRRRRAAWATRGALHFGCGDVQQDDTDTSAGCRSAKWETIALRTMTQRARTGRRRRRRLATRRDRPQRRRRFAARWAQDRAGPSLCRSAVARCVLGARARAV